MLPLQAVRDSRPYLWVTDCPLHASCALTFPSGTYCMACGCAIIDSPAGAIPTEASPELVSEAKEAWSENQGVRDFTASAREKNPPQTGDDDGPERPSETPA